VVRGLYRTISDPAPLSHHPIPQPEEALMERGERDRERDDCYWVGRRDGWGVGRGAFGSDNGKHSFSLRVSVHQ